MPLAVIRKTVSRCTWLRHRDWRPADFPELDRDWDFVHIPTLFRVHRAWDPFLFDWPGRAALAASDAHRALHFTQRVDVPSDVLPDGYFFLTEFATLPGDKIGRDFHNDKLCQLPDNRYVHRPSGIPMAGQLAKIDAFKAQSGRGSRSLQITYLYEVALDPRKHRITRRWLVHRVDSENFISELTLLEAERIERTLHVTVGDHPSPLPVLPISRPAALPTTYDDYLAATRVPELEAHPIEVLIYVLALGLKSRAAMHRLWDAVENCGPLPAIRFLELSPAYFEDGIPMKEGRHAFRCIPELLDHVQLHAQWLEKAVGCYDLRRALVPLLQWIVAVGPNPTDHTLGDCLVKALKADNLATNGALNRILRSSR